MCEHVGNDTDPGYVLNFYVLSLEVQNLSWEKESRVNVYISLENISGPSCLTVSLKHVCETIDKKLLKIKGKII